MKKNLPVTTVEYVLDESTIIMSRTDLKGRIAYVNEHFIEVSGFADQDLLGKPHNIVRHPDMPPEAFANMWKTLQAGEPWSGAVKNRRKNGDFYWVRASAQPIWENGEVTGYMSIRTKLSADQRREAEHIYALIRENKAQAYAMEAGGVIRRRSSFDRFGIFTKTLKARMTTMAAILMGFTLVVGGIGLLTTQRINAHLLTVYNDSVMPLYQLHEANVGTKESVLDLYKAAVDGRAGRADTEGHVSANIADADRSLREFRATNLDPEEKAVSDAYARDLRDLAEKGLKPGLALLSSQRFDELSKHVAGAVTPLLAAVLKDNEKLMAIQVEQAKVEYDSGLHDYQIAVATAIGALVASFVLGLLLVFQTMGAIRRPVEHLIEVMGRIARGEFNNRVIVERDDEIGIALRHLQATQATLGFNRSVHLDDERRRRRAEEEGRRSEEDAIERERTLVANSIGAGLARLAAKDLAYRMNETMPEAYRKLQTDFNEAIAQLEEAMRSVAASTDTIESGTREISSASDDLSRRTEQQAASLEETAAALDEITATVKKSAEGASHARQIVASAEEDAKKSGAVVRLTVEAMDAIAKSSQQISQIIGAIDEIAFQTNLLALNAGVEAARAGEAGRGFAVVASEVRGLALRSAEAAKEIKELISTSATQVDRGVSLVAETGRSLEQIMAQVTEISNVISQIAAGAAEQAAGLQEVNTAVNQMDQFTQQNATMVEELTAAGHSLSRETSQLSALIGQFQVGRASGVDPSHGELQKDAPLPFRQPAKAPAARTPHPEARKAAGMPMRAGFRAASGARNES